MNIPKIPKIPIDKKLKKAIDYIENKFSKNPGKNTGFFYPYNFKQAENWLNLFLETRFKLFGTYEDAISKNEPFLYHSLLSSSLNIGILTPKTVLDKSIDYAKNHRIPLNSIEGFVRQIIGWREFMRAVYLLKGSIQRNSNFFDNNNYITKEFYNGTTGIDPVDNVIQRVISNAYVHHIERLMILGNFMLICEIHPTSIYQWFMDMFIDSYDWVMVPNIYGMSQYADGGIMTTKPYISSSNYIIKMSDYKKGKWCDIWDSLFWRFIDKHQNFFKKNIRMRMLVFNWNKKNKDEKKEKIVLAEDFLKKLYN
jgi:deoxyribodipyrimidine photolyase-related protein